MKSHIFFRKFWSTTNLWKLSCLFLLIPWSNLLNITIPSWSILWRLSLCIWNFMRILLWYRWRFRNWSIW